MSEKICIAQSIEELKFVLNKCEESVVSIPLDLQTQLYCMKNNLKFYNPINFIDSNFHRDAIIESENLINQIDMSRLKYDSCKKIYADNIRFEFNSIIFLIELIEKIDSHKKINEIFISGWNGNIKESSDQDYFVSYLVSNLIYNKKVIKLSPLNNRPILFKKKIKYSIKNKNFDKQKKYILQNSLGYNLSRTIFNLKKKNHYILIPVFKNNLKPTMIEAIKKKIFRIFNVVFIEFIAHTSDEKNEISLPSINFFYKGKNISKLLHSRFVYNLHEYQDRREIVDDLFDKFNIKLVLSNVASGIEGYYLEISKKKNIPSILIPHGSLSEYFDKYDKIFKDQIAALHFHKCSKFFAIQSKIAKNYIQSYKINHNCIETGNLLFCNNRKSKKNKIVVAGTLKSFEGFRYLGYEMYYEFLENLNLFNKIAKKEKMQFLIKPHPSVNSSCINDLRERYKNLEFTEQKIDRVLKNAFVTISLSSTAIEDSLYSGIPVILFDRWQRYKHCSAEENIKKKNSPIYYLDNENDLVNCINTVKKSDNVSFKEFVFAGTTKKNIRNLIEKTSYSI